MAAPAPQNKAAEAEKPAPKTSPKPVKLNTPDGRVYYAAASEVDQLVNTRGYVRTK